MRLRDHRRATTIVASSVLLVACHGATIPNQVLTKPAPAAAPAPLPSTAGPWPYRPTPLRQQLAVDQRAVLAIHADTSTLTDTVASHADVSFTAAAATSGVTGEVAAFQVRRGGQDAATPTGLPVPFSFRALYVTASGQIDFVVPDEATPCASTALSVAQSLRDLWFRPPDTLRVGVAWEDSASYVLCRDGIPLRATVHRTFRVAGTVHQDGRTVLSISRLSRTSVDGRGVQFGETVSVSGNGSGDLTYAFDPVADAIVSATGSATMDLSFQSALRTQAVHQLVEIRIARR